MSKQLEKGVFITGTDTGVGKTFAAAALVKRLKAHYWKPVQTGPEEEHDAPEIQRLSCIETDQILPCLYSFPDPLSPHEAAKRVKQKIEFGHFKLPDIKSKEFLVVEGAGGVMVPLDDRHMMLDLMAQLELPALIVARSGLGTINHTLLTITALRNRGVKLAGVILNGPENKANLEAIEQYGKTEVLAELPFCTDVTPESLGSLMPRLDRVAQYFGRE
ncbi:dethiobiotin synthase [Kiloniella laminariae]|uniref:ATP-dependent dethiobiotin synthetase BioD n=1 Tax=Kiloniella laminariae TaxID=454162 RepID=A0ABT4LM52_9PROT|nr:dethiobiotin synthase [Kiloniella laminariae]MCZ4282141.1 dethiobiotin synthase [Kiloniella laminariae]